MEDTIKAENLGRDLGKRTDSVLYKRSALFVGDSICFGARDDSPYYNKDAWAGRIGTVNDMDYVNGGVGSSSCSTSSEGNRIVTQILANKGKTFDYVILHGGVNDAIAKVSVGEVTADDCFDKAAFDIDTFAGGLEEMIYCAKELFQNAKMGFIMNFSAPVYKFETEPHIEQYAAEARKICAKWNIAYLDLYNDRVFCEKVLKVDTNQYLPDLLHPNGAGYDVLYPVIEAWMETI